MTFLDKRVERRTVLKGFMIAGPTLTVAARFGLADGAGAFPTKTDELPDAQDFTDIFVTSQQPFIYDLKIEIKPDNRVYFELPKMDVGQGIITTAAVMVADNLDTAYENMDVVLSPAQQKWGPAQVTGGSHNTRVLWDPIRIVCAKMRGQLLAAGAQTMGLPVSQLRTEDGHVVATNGQKMTYGQLTELASKLIQAPTATPKTAKDFKLIGKPRTKYGLEKIVQGTFPYPLDIHSSKEFLPTVLAMAATHGATVCRSTTRKPRRSRASSPSPTSRACPTT
jgi:isoquinoline 1-oxidoreductase beta subunit